MVRRPRIEQERGQQSGGGSHNPESPRTTIDFVNTASTIPYYFAAIAGLVYAVGFLVEFTFMNSLGVKDSLTEAFKAKHMYIGFLCLQFPVSVIVVVLLVAKLKRTVVANGTPEEKKALSAYLPATLLLLNLLFAFYLLIGFARPFTFSNQRGAIAIFFGVTVLGIFSIAELQRKATQTGRIRTMETLKEWGITSNSWVKARWLLWGISLLLLIYIFHDLWGLLGEMLIDGGYLYFGVLALAGFWVWRLDVRRDESKHARPEMLMPTSIIGATIVSALLYLAVLFLRPEYTATFPSSKVVEISPRNHPRYSASMSDLQIQYLRRFLIQEEDASPSR